jgi:hypothetical protein
MVYMLVRSPLYIYFFFALKRYFELIFGYLVEQILNSEFSVFSYDIIICPYFVVLELYNFFLIISTKSGFALLNSSVGFTRLNDRICLGIWW